MPLAPNGLEVGGVRPGHRYAQVVDDAVVGSQHRHPSRRLVLGEPQQKVPIDQTVETFIESAMRLRECSPVNERIEIDIILTQ